MIRSPSLGFQPANIEKHVLYISIPASPTICSFNKLKVQVIQASFLRDDSCNPYDINLIFGSDIEYVYCFPGGFTGLDYCRYAIFDVEVRLGLMTVAQDFQPLGRFLDLAQEILDDAVSILGPDDIC